MSRNGFAQNLPHGKDATFELFLLDMYMYVMFE